MTVDYDPEADRYRASYDVDRVSPSLAVVDALAAVEGVDPMELEPVGTTVDLEALSAILRSGTDQSELTVTLRVQGYVLVLHGGGRLTLQPEDAASGDVATRE